MRKISLIAIFLFMGTKVQGTVSNVYFGTGGTATKGIYQAKLIYLLNELSLSVTTFKYDASTGIATRLSTTPALLE